ncbi:ATP-binding cassette domain-containing protein [Egicoccus sp. AB-alg2]|uniref:ATP-binding cassette domain-containing protein n=1 Tax=Egicoccus sp. AB-alg2 TaxID=3242693 RepID=UPI00359DC243
MPLLELADVSKHFAGVVALDGVNLTLERGERHAIIGPNGAGKSTMLKVISSELPASRGTVSFDGRDITRLSPDRIARAGISRTFQTSGYFAEDLVVENVMLAALARRDSGRWQAWRRLDRTPGLRERAMETLTLVGLEHRADEPADSLSHGEHRQLEIAMALVQQPQILLADEPLAGLAQVERERISDLLRALDRELTMIIVEHDLEFALGIADTTTVLHLGKVLSQGSPEHVRGDPEVERIYTGGRSLDEAKDDTRTGGRPRLTVRGLHAGYGQAEVLHGIDLHVGEGEIVALLGRNGMGKSTTLNCLMGLLAPTAGTIEVDEQDVTRTSSLHRSRAGVGLVPQGRRILADLTVEEQLKLGQRPGTWTLERIYELFPNLADRRRLIATHLSGGEQQMLALGRVLMRNPSITLLDEPSEGLSPLMVTVVRDTLMTLSEEGETVLLAEQNVPMALSVADRLYVIDRGEIVFEGRPKQLRDDPALLRSTLGV